MKHKQNMISVVSVIGGLMLLLSGCARIDEGLFGGPGSRIRFTAASSYDNGPATKTAYSGEYTGTSNNIERINWEVNDQMTIAYVHGSTTANADYDVTGESHSSGETNSNATVQASGSALEWEEGSGNHVFYAMYPSRAFSADQSSASLTDAGVFSGVIPAIQTVTSKTLESGVTKYEPDMKYGFLVATTTLNSIPASGEVDLFFKPAMTAFEFVVGVKSDAPALTLNTFEMSSEASLSSTGALTGTFSAKLNGTSADVADWQNYSKSNAGNTISVDFRTGGTGIAINSGNAITFTVFAMPQDLSGITVKFGTSEGVKTLKLKQNGTFMTFTGGKKYRISNLNLPYWSYTIEVVDPVSGESIDVTGNPLTLYGHDPVSGDISVKSYRSNNLTDDKLAVAWKIQYTTDDGASWTDLPAAGVAGDNNAQFSITSAPNGTGVDNSTYAVGEPRVANIGGSHNNHHYSGDTGPQIARAHLRSATPRPSTMTDAGDGFFDLSKHPIYGTIDGPEGYQNTANCYVISAPGSYKFPLVYGNAIQNGADNKSAYWPADATTTSVSHPADPNYGAITYMSDINAAYNQDSYVNHYYLPQFYNGLNVPITSPYILSDIGVSVSNVEPVIVWQDKDNVDDTAILPMGSSTNIGISGSGSSAYIWFKIEPQDIRPGNILIALRRKSDKKILWSWHIWITDRDLAPTDVLRGINLMSTNLGFIEGSDGAVDKYNDRGIKYRAVSYTTEGSTVTIQATHEFKVIQIGDAREYLPSIGSSPYYQWGRKDPIIPSLPDGGSRLIIRNPEYPDLPDTDSGEGKSISMEILPDNTTVDYGTSINKPYKPLFNNATTSWVGGPVYPFYKGWRLTKHFTGPFTFDEAMNCNYSGLTTSSDWTVIGANFYINETPPYSYKYETYTTLQMNYLLLTGHFATTDFTGILYTAAERSASALAYNLWNSFIYSDGVNTKDNKFKTIYDPCPPGFTVPVRYLFVGNTWPLTWIDSQPGTPKHRENASPMALSPAVSVDRATSNKGVYYGGVFFPYIGGRVLIYTDMTAQEQGTGAYYWSDNPFNIQGTNAPAGNPDAIGSPADPTDLAYHWFYQFGLILSLNNSGSTVTSSPEKAWSFTKGSGASIRPMVDPHYNP